MKVLLPVLLLSLATVSLAGPPPRQKQGTPNIANLSAEDRQKFEALQELMAGAQRVPVRWRYRVIDLNVSRLKPTALEAILDTRAGRFGFELVGMTAALERGKTRFIFKAKVPQKPQ